MVPPAAVAGRSHPPPAPRRPGRPGTPGPCRPVTSVGLSSLTLWERQAGKPDRQQFKSVGLVVPASDPIISLTSGRAAIRTGSPPAALRPFVLLLGRARTDRGWGSAELA